MTNTELKALRESLIYANNSQQITADNLASILDELINKTGGWVSYRNSTTAYQIVAADTPTKLTNDGAGDSSIITYKPHYITNPILSNSAIQMSEFPTGTIIHGRFSSDITTTSNNTEIKLKARFYRESGDLEFEYDFANVAFKTQGSHSITETGIFYVGDELLNGRIEFYAEADHGFEINWADLILDIR
jgi:hypothetical protein